MCYIPVIQGKVDAIEAHICFELHNLKLDNKQLFYRLEEGNSGYCCVCGAEIKNANLQRKTRDFLWCTRKCYSAKPRKIIALEKIHSKDIKEILIDTTRNYQNIRAQQNALRVSTPYLYQIIRKYFGYDYISFFAEYAVGKRKIVYTRKISQRKGIKLPG